MLLRLISLTCVAASLCACSQPFQAQRSFVPAVTDAATTSGTVVFRVDARSRGMTPAYLSPASKGISVRVKGPTDVSRAAGLSVTDKGCRSTLMTAQCVVTLSGLKPCASRKPCYTADVGVYDAYDAAANKIPKSAHELSAVSGLKFSISSGQTLIPLVLDGLPKTIAFLPAANTTLTGSQSTGFIEPKCNLSPQTVSVVGVDADGNYIVGPGAPKTSLASNDTPQLSVKRGKSSEPNAYTLSPPVTPKYAYGGHTVTLTAKTSPEKKSLGREVTATINVTYSGDICGIFDEFSVAGSAAFGIVTGPDGNIWFTESSSNKIGHMTTAGTELTEFSIPTAASKPIGITVGPDRNLWFTEDAGGKIGRITTAGSITEFTIPTSASQPIGIVSGPDGNLWFAEDFGDNIGRITPAGKITEYPTPTSGVGAFGIGVGPDKNIWFTEPGADKIGYITTAGTDYDVTVPTAASSPLGIIAGPDGNVWFSECTGNRIGRIFPGTAAFSGSPLPGPKSGPAFLVNGPDGAVWFTEYKQSRIGRVGGLQTFTEFSVPTASSQPIGIAVGPDGAIWFAESAGNKIGRLR